MQGGKIEANREVVDLILFGRLTRGKNKSLNLLLIGGIYSSCHMLPLTVILTAPSVSHYRKCKLL